MDQGLLRFTDLAHYYNFETPKDTDYRYAVFDIQGKLIQSWRNTEGNIHELTIEHAPSQGRFYFVHLETRRGPQQKWSKFVKVFYSSLYEIVKIERQN